jgi:hypothetical protein
MIMGVGRASLRGVFYPTLCACSSEATATDGGADASTDSADPTIVDSGSDACADATPDAPMDSGSGPVLTTLASAQDHPMGIAVAGAEVASRTPCSVGASAVG